jgi:hypothetical protein
MAAVGGAFVGGTAEGGMFVEGIGSVADEPQALIRKTNTMRIRYMIICCRFMAALLFRFRFSKLLSRLSFTR